jgi:hypothetical protein
MNSCLRAKLPYMPIFLPQAPSMSQALKIAQATVPPSTPMAQVPFRSQLFILETAAALQAQAYHDSEYGPGQSSSVNPAVSNDYLVGWLDHCLANAGIAPQSSNEANPGADYAAFLGTNMQDARVFAFGTGYAWDVVAPVSLQPPKSAPPAP